ncbi:WD40-repeat-containing domain protein [Chiua virens]|nr:WD40-repeat-containing domain protein [Chiua virens]
MGTKALKIALQCGITSLSFEPDRAYFMTAGHDGSLRQWNATDRVQDSLWTKNIGRYINVVAVSPDGQWIVAGGRGGLGNTVTIWSTATRECVIEVAGHTEAISALDISNDSTRFASGSTDKTVQIVDIISGTRVIPPIPHERRIGCVKFSQDATRIATSSYYCSVGVYNSSSGNKLFEISISGAYGVPIPLAWSSDDQQLFVACPGKITCVETSKAHSTEWPMHENNNQQMSIIKPSPIGQIARAIALVGAGEQEVALDELDLVFRDCDQSDIKVLLVVNVRA